MLVVGDALVSVGVFVGIVVFRRMIRLPGTIGRLPAYKVPLDVFPWLLIVALAALVSLYLVATYEEPAASVRERGGLLVAAILSAGILVVAYFAAGRAVPRTVLLVYVPVLYMLLGVWRSLAERLSPIGDRPVIVLGSGEDARRAALALRRGEITGHSLLAWREDLSALRSPREDASPDLSTIPEGALDVVFASELPEDRATLIGLLERSLKNEFELWILPGLTDIVASRVVTRSLGDLPLTPVASRGASLFALGFRRLLDLTIGTALFVVSLPLLVLATGAVVIESRGRPWIRQKRVGLGGAEFSLLKIRTMCSGAEDDSGPRMSEPNDDRLTRVGRLLRRTRLDELPQLLHVLSGAMSLIGPRPERPEFVAGFVHELPAYRLRHMLKPGLTGLAQVMGAYATKPDVKLRYDLGYLFHWNPLLDVFILIRTITTILKGSGV
jgi:lipopolysaccharide/colanic/teichoic acid biosynthesis glycosyltransferase